MASEIYCKSVPAVLCPPTWCSHHLKKKKKASTYDFLLFCNSKKNLMKLQQAESCCWGHPNPCSHSHISPRINPFLVLLKRELSLVSTSQNCQSWHKVLHGVQQPGAGRTLTNLCVFLHALISSFQELAISGYGSEVKVCSLNGLFQQIWKLVWRRKVGL